MTGGGVRGQVCRGGDQEAQPDVQRHVQCGYHLVDVLSGKVSNVHVLDVVAEGSQGMICPALYRIHKGSYSILCVGYRKSQMMSECCM